MSFRPAPGRQGQAFSLSRLVAALFLPFLLIVPDALAHDLWIVPGQFRLRPRETTRVFIVNGDAFPVSSTLLGRHRIESLYLHVGEERQPIADLRVDGRAQTFELSIPQGGYAVLALATEARRVRLTPDDFTDYLEEEGLTRIATLREELGQVELATVERYQKWAKAILRVEAPDEGAGEGADAVGHRIEIVPVTDPFAIGPRDDLVVRVLFESEPAPGLRVVGGIAGGPERIEGVTNSAGELSLTIPEPGRWYVRTIHMIPAEDNSETDWESYWATLSFEIAEEDD